MTTKNYDLIILGAGPGGYVAAIRAAQLGFKTACVDGWIDANCKPSLGGTCLNAGCIPTKALLDSSQHYYNLTHLLPTHGIQVDNARVEISAMQARKDKVVATLTTGIKGLFKKNDITWFPGQGAFLSPNRIQVTHRNGDKSILQAPNIIIATGSVPASIPVAPVDNRYIVDSTGALNLETVPERLGIIGAGVIGLELGSVWSRLGAKVILLEAENRFLPGADHQIAREAYKIFKKQGLDIRLGALVKSAEVSSAQDGSGHVTITYEVEGKPQSFDADKLVVACGRQPVTAGLRLEEVGIALDQRGGIQVDAHCRTNVEGIYAIGDVVRGPMLAHKASEEGIAVVERIAGQSSHLHYDTIPQVIYTHPEIAWVGKTEAALQADNIPFRVGHFPFRAIGRAHGSGETDGFAKIIGDAKTDRILGVHLFGANASELIAEAVTAMEFSASTEDLARIIHAHPTLSEALHEAALAVEGRAIHL
uniref:Dihydrolipoyl dehydrogenase n=1 Tax=Candidatus Kentrum sp. MB TaxID=2138164 RepID=A0A450XE07_9GAMM|nr:MAG: dihydrolipoamide dehydrogenase [Candidatus Kentron sp. MB]VFK31599.1 MAG: dihydrolipoamide dehydrogenase [Candidatus Kentron sp. MB]VFK74339.1 MAG: dihydrolipoamide dehydrogenase [Candidatus Kentron sp. MB]